MSDPAPHLIPTVSDRGFQRLPPIHDDSRRGRVQVYESSAAVAPHIWLTSSEAAEHRPTSIHLTLAQARQLAEQLLFLADNHYQEASGE